MRLDVNYMNNILFAGFIAIASAFLTLFLTLLVLRKHQSINTDEDISSTITAEVETNNTFHQYGDILDWAEQEGLKDHFRGAL